MKFLRAGSAFGLLAIIVASLTIFAPSVSHAVSKFRCGPVLSSTYRDDTKAFATGSTDYTAIPGALVNVTVPTGKTRCITVRFSAVASCSPTPGQDRCQIEANENDLHGGAVLTPQETNLDFVSEDPSASAHSFIWVYIISSNAEVSMSARVKKPGTLFVINTWTMEVQVSEHAP